MKYYTIRKGKKTWIFNTWDETQALVVGFPDAKYKSFPTKQEAENALQQGRESYYTAHPKQKLRKQRDTLDHLPFIKESVAVDAACSWNPWALEYRGIDLQSGEEIFHQQFEIWTNNIGEFLAIVHGLAYCAPNRPNTIYSDSKTAISRAKQGKCKSKFRTLQPERTVRNAVERAEKRLKKNWIPSTLLKRNTDERGEIPADFGRK